MVNNSVAVGAAGYVDQMKTLVEELKGRLGNDILEGPELKTKIEDVLLDLHKRYNITWSNRLGEDTEVFTLNCLLGAEIKGKYVSNVFAAISPYTLGGKCGCV